ncbi:MAG: hypothetical protein ABEL76_17620, partial [Bradymonadaceae bacterium]
MERRIRQAIRWLVGDLVAERYVAITVVSLVVTVVAGWTLVSEWSIDSDFRALLPADARPTRALEYVESRLGSATAMFVVVSSPSLASNKRFAEDLAEKLRAMDEVALAHFHNEKSFFERRQLLYLSVEELKELHDELETRIRRAKRRANPLYVPLDGDESEQSAATFARRWRTRVDQFEEYLVSDDRRSLTIFVRLSQAGSNLEQSSRVLERIERTARSLRPSTYHPKMTVDYGGGLVARQQQYATIMDDVGGAAFGELAVLCLLLALFFRRLRAVI